MDLRSLKKQSEKGGDYLALFAVIYSVQLFKLSLAYENGRFRFKISMNISVIQSPF